MRTFLVMMRNSGKSVNVSADSFDVRLDGWLCFTRREKCEVKITTIGKRSFWTGRIGEGETRVDTIYKNVPVAAFAPGDWLYCVDVTPDWLDVTSAEAKAV